MEQSILPAKWEVPEVFRQRLGDKAGRQRPMVAEGHLLLVLHAPPQPEQNERVGRFFWRSPEGNWVSKDLGTGVNAISKHLDEYQTILSRLDQIEEQASTVPREWFDEVSIARAEGDVTEPQASTLGWGDLGREWEWENSPEVTLAIVGDVDHAVDLFNTLSPRFAASLISNDATRVDRFFDAIDSPFVGDGFTRWVDGQFALNKPELGLSNWQFGRLFGRGGVLSGDSVYTIRSRATQYDGDLRR